MFKFEIILIFFSGWFHLMQFYEGLKIYKLIADTCFTVDSTVITIKVKIRSHIVSFLICQIGSRFKSSIQFFKC